MKRISYIILCCVSLLTGCQTADFATSKLNPANLLPGSSNEVQSQAEIEANSKKFLAEIKDKAANDSEDVQRFVQQGQQEIVSWYQDQDDRHISAAKQNFRNALKLQPKDNVDSLHGLAVVADLEENFAVAEQHYQLALAQAPSDSNILGNLGYSYLLQNRLKESERYLSRANQIDPGNVDAVKHLGDVYAKLGQPGKAQSVLAQVMSSEEARRVVESHTQPVGGGSSEPLLGKLIPNQQRTPPAEPQEDQLRVSQAEMQSRQEMMRFHNSAAGYQYPPNALQQIPQTQYSQDQLISQLTAIDQERNQNLTGGPVMIHSGTGQMQHDSLPANRGPQMLANAPGQIPPQGLSQSRYGSNQPLQQNAYPPNSVVGASSRNPVTLSTSPTNDYSEMSPYQQQQFARSQQVRHATSRIQSSNQFNPATMNQRGMGNSQFQQGHAPQQADPLQKPWGSLNQQRAVPVSYEQQESMQPYPGPQSRGSADAQAQLAGSRQGSVNSYPRDAQSHTNQDMGNASFNRNDRSAIQTPSQNSIENASLQAAKLGMGVGPGNMFPAVNETAPNQQPGMQSNWNGGSFGTSQRLLPSDLAPLNLSQAQSGQPAVNSLGQKLPGSNVTNQFGQFGTASRYDAQIRQSNNTPSQYQQAQADLQRQQYQIEQQLREQRVQSQNQLNEQTQDVWDQRPLTLHTPAAGGPKLLSPAEYGGMVPVNPQEQTGGLPPYPYAQQSRAESERPSGQTQQNQYGERLPQRMNSAPTRYYDTNSNQRIVEPPPYESTRNSTRSRNQSADYGVQQTGYSTPMNSSNQYQERSGYQGQSRANMPMIIPGTP